ncbi:hypothetical protein Hanom_Chr04g00375031 [Helianthus anomalus]
MQDDVPLLVHYTPPATHLPLITSSIKINKSRFPESSSFILKIPFFPAKL